MKPPYTLYLCTLEDVTRQLDKALPTNPSTSVTNEYADYATLVTSLISQVSTWIGDYTGRSFAPYVRTIDMYQQDFATQKTWSRNALYLPDDLTSVTSIVFSDETLIADQYRLDGYGAPYQRIRFNNVTFDMGFDSTISIEGRWGYSETYSATTYTTAQSVTTTTTDIVYVSDYTVFDTYQYIKIDDEIMLITDRSDSHAHVGDHLHVIRGCNGTTASTHSNGATIQVLLIEPDVRLVATRMVAWLYQKRTDVGDVVQLADGAVIISQAPPLIKQVLNGKVRLGVIAT